MAEENRQDLLLELVDVVDDEGEPVGVPADDLLVQVILNRNWSTSRISKVLEIKIEGLDTRYLRPRTPKLIS